MQTINFELSKRLNDLWLLDNIETKYIYFLVMKYKDSPVKPTLYKTEQRWSICITSDCKYFVWDFKTLTLSEAMEFLRVLSLKNRYKFSIDISKNEVEINWLMIANVEKWESLLEAIEKIIKFL